MKKFADWLREFWNTTPKPRLFVSIYLAVVTFGVLLGILSIFIPFLNTCLSLFGNRVCSPVGDFIAIFASFPGYFLSAIVLSPFKSVPDVISLTLVGIISLLFYYGAGKLVASKNKRDLSLRNVIFWVAVGGFLILLLLFFYLMLAVKN
jgi:hypothetical protein